MKHIYTIAAILSIVLLVSCKPDEATISVTNNIKNVRLESVSFGDEISVTSNLLPGETGSRTIDEYMSTVDFPMTKQIRFYMVKGDNRVLLYTKGTYKVDKDDELKIVLTDDTEVVNPMNSTSRVSSIQNIANESLEEMEISEL